MLEGVKKTEAKKFEKYLVIIERQIRQKLIAEGLTIRNKTRLAAILADIKRINKEQFEGWVAELVENLGDVAITESDLEVNLLNKSIPDFEAVLPAEVQILSAFKQNALSLRGKSQGLTLEPFLQQYTADQKQLIEGLISQGFQEGKTTQQIIQDLRGTKALNFQDGILDKVNRNTEIMVRTAVQNASAQAKQAIWEANSDVVQGVEWVSTLDSRTTSQCRSLDAQVFPVDSGPRPPIHYGCRSTTAPAIDPRFDFLKEGETRPAIGEDASGANDRGVVKNQTYYEWLKTQPAQFQDKVLGGTRGALFRNGGLNADQFSALQLNSNFLPMTLEEMASEAPEAFSQANLLNPDGSVKIVSHNVQPN